jgi:hypothetical protein
MAQTTLSQVEQDRAQYRKFDPVGKQRLISKKTTSYHPDAL